MREATAESGSGPKQPTCGMMRPRGPPADRMRPTNKNSGQTDQNQWFRSDSGWFWEPCVRVGVWPPTVRSAHFVLFKLIGRARCQQKVKEADCALQLIRVRRLGDM